MRKMSKYKIIILLHGNMSEAVYDLIKKNNCEVIFLPIREVLGTSMLGLPDISQDHVYIYIPPHVHPSHLPISHIDIKYTFAAPSMFMSGICVITETQRKSKTLFVTFAESTPFRVLSDNIKDLPILESKYEDLTITKEDYFWAMNRIIMTSWHSKEFDKGKLAIKNIIDQLHDVDFQDIFLEHFDIMIKNIAFYFKPTIIGTTIFPLESIPSENYKLLTKPEVFVINLKHRTDRLNAISARLEKLEFNYTVVEAVDKNDPLVKERTKECLHLNNHPRYDKMSRFACLTSHLKAIKAFLATDEEYGMIIEDDIVFHKKFNTLYNQLMGKMKPGFRLLSLISFSDEFTQSWSSRCIQKEKCPNPVAIDHNCWTAFAYIISRDCAKWALETFDKAYHKVPTIPRFNYLVTSECIIMYSGGYVSSVPLVIDDMSTSDIGIDDVEHHTRVFKKLGLENYDLE